MAETQPDVLCAYCGKPITKEDRPAVQMQNGDQVHAWCWNNYDLNHEQRPN